MKQLFKPQLKMEQFIFKLELSSAEQEGRKWGCTGTPGATQGRCHRPLEPRCSKKEGKGKGTEQRLPTAPQRDAGCFLPIPQQPTPDPTTPLLSHKGRGFGLHLLGRLSPGSTAGISSSPPEGREVLGGICTTGVLPFQPGARFLPTRCLSPQAQLLPPKSSPGKPTPGTQPSLPRRGDHQPVSCAQHRENPRQQEAAGRGLGREGGRAATTTKTHPLFS